MYEREELAENICRLFLRVEKGSSITA